LERVDRGARERLRADIELLPLLAERGLCDAAKDISNAGAIGTTLMLLECSKVGASIDVLAIPRPEGVPLLRWLQSFPSYGFVFSVRPSHEAGGAGTLRIEWHRLRDGRRGHGIPRGLAARRRRVARCCGIVATEAFIGARSTPMAWRRSMPESASRAPGNPALRIALLTHSVNPRGGVVHTLELADALHARGHHVTVLAPAADGSETISRRHAARSSWCRSQRQQKTSSTWSPHAARAS
jgi:hypothetical protein